MGGKMIEEYFERNLIETNIFEGIEQLGQLHFTIEQLILLKQIGFMELNDTKYTIQKICPRF